MARLRIYILTILALLCSACSPGSSRENQPIVKNGVADISSVIFPAGGIVTLDGRWEFYYGRLLEPGDFKSGEPAGKSFIEVPNAWDDFMINGKKAGSWGYATYRIRVITANDDPLYMKVMPQNSAFRLWTNGTYQGSVGRVGMNRDEEIPDYELNIYEVRPENNSIEIIIQVSNYSIYLGGLRCPVIIGTRELVYSEKNRMIAFDIFIFASLLVISMYYFGLFLMRRSDKSNLLFSVFTLMLSARTLVNNEYYLYELLPDANWEYMFKIDFLATTLCIPVFIYFIYLLYPVIVGFYIRMFFVVCSIIYSYLILFFPLWIYSPYMPYYNAITLAGCLFTFYVLIRAVIDKKEGAKLALLGFCLLFLTVVNDILSVNSIINTIQLSSFGVFAFILMQSFISSMKFANAYTRIEELSYNLEIKVRLRTQELEEEKELLRIRNQTIENELIIAKKIQKQIIPRHSPVENIYAFYKPMDKVGGDFYDFLRYRDTEKIGIFLSDVSGHGVPAAFITSMVKTSILQAGTDREDPSSLLSSLNDMLINQTGGHFVTAFYGIFNTLTREFTWSNSGHNPPFILSENEVSELTGKKSIPLAILNNEVMDTAGKPRMNNTITLNKGDRLLFYTDGLTEATSIADRKQFFEDLLVNEHIKKYSSCSTMDFIHNLYNELVLFHGSDSFEDDVCMICMDIE